MVKNSLKNDYEIRIYLLPKEKRMLICTNSVYNAIKNLEDYELEELSETAINEKINEYNKEKEYKYFDRMKAKDFIFIEAHIYKIGKYKFANLHTMDYLQ